MGTDFFYDVLRRFWSNEMAVNLNKFHKFFESKKKELLLNKITFKFPFVLWKKVHA